MHLHFDYGIPAEFDADAPKVAQQCVLIGVPFHIATADGGCIR